MPFTAKAKNLLLIIQNLIYIYEDKYLSQDLTSILHNTLDVSVEERREGVVTPSQETAGGRREPASLVVTAPQQTRDVERMFAQWWPTVYSTGPALAYQ